MSIIVASGDFGVDGAWDEFAGTGTFQCPKRCCPHFNPVFPASSPWVTAVGSTTFLTNQPQAVDDTGIHAHAGVMRRHSKTGEVAADFSGGGFSRIFAVPNYQQRSIGRYFRNRRVRAELPTRKLYALRRGAALVSPADQLPTDRSAPPEELHTRPPATDY